MKPVTVFNFSGAYERQDFYKTIPCKWVDLTDLTGVCGYCDGEALLAIEERAGESPQGVHFIDGGNYHYVSYAMARQQKEPFTLVVFDHHTDMVPPNFEGLLSCGCWVKRALEDTEELKEVILIGVADELSETIEPGLRARVTLYTESMLTDNSWLSHLAGCLKRPVYLSIDKDVLSKEAAITDWDQGSMTLEQLIEAVRLIKDRVPILGADVCGEYDGRGEALPGTENGDEKNNSANKRLLNLLSGE